MRGQLLWITAVILCGLTVGIGWSAISPALLGEVVPDEVAATLRGGVCNPKGQTKCLDGPNPDQNGHNCAAKTVWDVDKNGNTYPYVTTVEYCGGTALNCGVYPNVDTTLDCATSN